ncbi:MAG TPA: hypothetical protein VMT45_02940 [Thermoanaerobaculaceae bacterium]|nr:hypothetical protein [Thermoanaerobaculaceae bacterium]
MRVNPILTVLGSALVLATTLACSTATPTETAGVERIGRTMLRYRGPELEVTLSYGFANANLGEEWLFVDTAITGNVRESVEVKRDRIAVRTPSGDIVPLASQREFGEAYGKLAAALARADVAAQPIGNYPERRVTGLDFLVVPGTGVSLESVWVNDRNVAIGRLFFDLPMGIQAGSYELRIDLEETKIRIPFRLGEGQGPGEM